MRVCWILAKNTFREIIRDRILYGLVVFALLLVGVSLALGQLSFSEQARISANFGFSGMHLSAMILSIFVGASLVAKEIEKKTVMTLLVRPMTRMQFLFGKALGLLGVILTVLTGLAFVILFIFLGLGLDIYWSFGVALWGVLLEAILLLGVALLFSSFAKPMMVVVFSLGLFLIGHWSNNLQFLAQKSDDATFKAVAKFVEFGLPNLEKFNWRGLVLNDVPMSSEVLYATLYSFAWFGICLSLTGFILRRKDFG